MVAAIELVNAVRDLFAKRYQMQGVAFARASMWAQYHGACAGFALALRQAYARNDIKAALALSEPTPPRYPLIDINTPESQTHVGTTQKNADANATARRRTQTPARGNSH